MSRSKDLRARLVREVDAPLTEAQGYGRQAEDHFLAAVRRQRELDEALGPRDADLAEKYPSLRNRIPVEPPGPTEDPL